MALVSDFMSIVSDSPMDGSLLNDPNIIPPEGWTKDKRVMEYRTIWANSNSTLHQMIREYELGTPKPIMSCDSDSGEFGTLFQAGTKYYLWKPDMLEILEIITSMSLEDLITKIDKHGHQSLKYVRVPDWYWSKVRVKRGGKRGSRKAVMKPGVKADTKQSRKPAKKLDSKKQVGLRSITPF